MPEYAHSSFRQDFRQRLVRMMNLFTPPEVINCPICSSDVSTSDYLNHLASTCLDSLPDPSDPAFMSAISHPFSCPFCDLLNINRPVNIFDLAQHSRHHITLSKCTTVSEMQFILAQLHPTYDAVLKQYIFQNVDLRNDRTLIRSRKQMAPKKPNGFTLLFKKLFSTDHKKTSPVFEEHPPIVKTPSSLAPQRPDSAHPTPSPSESSCKCSLSVSSMDDFQFLNVPFRLKESTPSDNSFDDIFLEALSTLFPDSANNTVLPDAPTFSVSTIQSDSTSSIRTSFQSSQIGASNGEECDSTDVTTTFQDNPIPHAPPLPEEHRVSGADTSTALLPDRTEAEYTVFHSPHELPIPSAILVGGHYSSIPQVEQHSTSTERDRSSQLAATEAPKKRKKISLFQRYMIVNPLSF
ncbi:hypothetical protein BLNAU_15622 [Blattamonas nauphoetae]|uniref:UBZ4-type domain-containing protein n=1 Tax=Blattamonas nauphoetae TaxID=2049346 RepID=A0ABQ9XBX1_9EUKA|nr:hypothetical protein BLNAU_15622 [Blattamonas nauphoetae]